MRLFLQLGVYLKAVERYLYFLYSTRCKKGFETEYIYPTSLCSKNNPRIICVRRTTSGNNVCEIILLHLGR